MSCGNLKKKERKNANNVRKPGHRFFLKCLVNWDTWVEQNVNIVRNSYMSKCLLWKEWSIVLVHLLISFQMIHRLDPRWQLRNCITLLMMTVKLHKVKVEATKSISIISLPHSICCSSNSQTFFWQIYWTWCGAHSPRNQSKMSVIKKGGVW